MYITGVKKSDGEIIGYQLDNGQIVSKAEGVEMAKQGLIKYVNVSVSKKGEEYLRSLPDEYSGNNLDSLPVVDTDNQIDQLPITSTSNTNNNQVNEAPVGGIINTPL